ncbi:hypothetical protein [Nonomuraea cavernae]|uniref:PE domain-containing protein n=1 Tax=Nonomuraea cavernae TaxID=2045107 RepID=A0A918DUJ4_9ACTN|nr:hypothetical protein [Nonomuraea cavernae]MCA2190079.1 hypothetical protein [Nonomuraea cavernae]GGO83023.1 hypothetical protein GCM10012289_75620 [Nonomuraea cavernae]
MAPKEATKDGGNPLVLDPKWPGLDGGEPVEYSVTRMRAIARDLASAKNLDQHLGRLGSDTQLSPAEVGQWDDAQAFSKSVGETSAAAKFLQAYTDFANAYDQLVAAIEANADAYANTNSMNEGGSEV